MNNLIKILIADENGEERRHLRESLELAGYRGIEEAENGEIALARIERWHPDVVITDAWLSRLEYS